jgi:hypothetical protein
MEALEDITAAFSLGLEASGARHQGLNQLLQVSSS